MQKKIPARFFKKGNTNRCMQADPRMEQFYFSFLILSFLDSQIWLPKILLFLLFFYMTVFSPQDNNNYSQKFYTKMPSHTTV